ncbi:MAG: SPASM domain-containing protein [Lachnospiraceae bacterium]|nr:SPASM domain-containing protein [Lachnospiraceae bacterium]
MNQIIGYSQQELEKAVLNYKQVYVYGAGVEGKRVLEELMQYQIPVTAIVVTSKQNNPDTVMGVKVIELKNVVPDDKTMFIIGVSRKYEQQVAETLWESGHCHVVSLLNKKWKKNRIVPKLEITVKMGCGVQCKYCPQQELLHTYFGQEKSRESWLSLENYKKAIDHMPKETIITFSGFAEPFLHPQAIEMIEYANQTGHPVELYTTFVNLSEKDFDRIKDIPFRTVVLHTPDKMNYAIIPITDNYKKIMDKALSHKKPNGETFIDSANCQSEPSEEFLELAKGRIEVKSTLIDRAGLLEGEDLKKSIHKTGKLVCKRSYLQNHWVLLPDGTTVLCCMDFALRHVLGNLFYESYEQICENSVYQGIRKQMDCPSPNRELLCCDCTASLEIAE